MLDKIPDIPLVLNMPRFQYARVAQISEQDTPFDRVLNVPLVLKWQCYRKFYVKCILEIPGILNMS